MLLLQETGETGGEGLLTAALISVLAAALTFATNQVHEIFRRRHEQKELAQEREEAKRLRREALLIAFYGEINTITNFLRMEAERGRVCLVHGLAPEIRSIKLPNHVFHATASNLGELGDSKLVARLVTFYSIADSVNEEARVIEDLAGRNRLKEYKYLSNLSACLGTAVYLHAQLEKATEQFRVAPSILNRAEFEVAHGDHLKTVEGLAQLSEELLADIRREHEASSGSTSGTQPASSTEQPA